MADIKIEFNSAGFEQILCSDGAMALCEKAGKEIQARANSELGEGSSGFNLHSTIGSKFGSRRCITFVYTTDRASMIAESENKVLSKAVK